MNDNRASASTQTTQTTKADPSPKEIAAAQAAAAQAAAEEARRREESARQYQQALANTNPTNVQIMTQTGSSARARRGVQGG